MIKPISKKKKVLLIGWDSADWKIIDPLLKEGGLDGIRELKKGGTHGNLATLEPQLSPMLWSSIATGKMAYHHGVPGFTEVDPVSGQVTPVSAATRQCKTVWEMLGEHDLKSHVVSWFATQGEQNLNGKMVSNMFGHLKGATADMDPADFPPPMPGTYWPESLADEMNELRVSPHEIDEDILQPFLPAGYKIDQDRDKRLNNLRNHLAEAYSVHSAATHLMQTDPDWDFMAVYYRAVDEISHHFMHYHAPQMEGIPDEDFEIYQHVINGTYRAHDMMLQTLLKMAGPDTTVILISDHGFHSDHLRPKFTPRVPAGITVWHRQQGVLMAKGPGIKPEQEVYGARLLDITPTILHHFGLPVGADMEGRVLTELFSDTHPVKSIPTWENADGSSQKRGSLSEEESQALLQQFVDLGYIDEVSSDSTEAAQETNRENKWNLARAYLYTGKHAEALPLLEDCFNAYPERTDYSQSLAKTQFALGLTEEAEETLEICLESFGKTIAARILQAKIEIQKGNHKEAIESLEGAITQAPEDVHVLELCCQGYTGLHEMAKARTVSDTLLRVDPSNILAHNTRARCQIAEENYAAAVDTALAAIALEFAAPRAHTILGTALLKLNKLPEAEHSFVNALKLNPDSPSATEQLIQVYQLMGDEEKALVVQGNETRLKLKQTVEKSKQLQSLRSGIASRAKARHAERKKQREETAAKIEAEASIQPNTFTIVSGLPRSGTSLMMQMLRSGGMELMHDGKRKADEDNLEGYWEWEDIKSLKKNPRAIEQADGKVIKVVSALLPQLPPRHSYRIIFMKRPVEEVVESQWKMLERNGTSPRSERQHLIQTQETHLKQTLAQLKQRNDVELIEIDYPELVASPETQLPALQDFLKDSITQPEKLTSVIRPDLHRNRSGQANLTA